MAGSLGIQESDHLDYKSNQFCYRFKFRTFSFSLFFCHEISDVIGLAIRFIKAQILQQRKITKMV